MQTWCRELPALPSFISMHPATSTSVNMSNRDADKQVLGGTLHTTTPASLSLLSWEAGPANGAAERRLEPKSTRRLMCLRPCVDRCVFVKFFQILQKFAPLCHQHRQINANTILITAGASGHHGDGPQTDSDKCQDLCKADAE